MMQSLEQPVLLAWEGNIAVLTLNQPDRFNAVSLKMREALVAHLTELQADDNCRAIVLTGAGGNFCSGGDISEMKPREILEGRARVDLATRIFRMMVTGPKPIITAVEGRAFGCGVSFVAASDYAVAASDASFSCAFIKVGLMADFGGIWSIARRIGHRKAMEMCAFGDVYDASQALDMQLLNQTCHPGDALAAALAAAERFARNPPIAMAMLRTALNNGGDTIDQAISTEISNQALLMNTQDFAEATQAFREKRKPRFTGR